VFDDSSRPTANTTPRISGRHDAMFLVRTRWVWYGLSRFHSAQLVTRRRVPRHEGCVLVSACCEHISWCSTPRWSTRSAIRRSLRLPRFELNDGKTNELVISILTLVKGCTNNHHRFRGTHIVRTPGTKSTAMADHSGVGKSGSCTTFRRRARVGRLRPGDSESGLNTAASSAGIERPNSCQSD